MRCDAVSDAGKTTLAGTAPQLPLRSSETAGHLLSLRLPRQASPLLDTPLSPIIGDPGRTHSTSFRRLLLQMEPPPRPLPESGDLLLRIDTAAELCFQAASAGSTQTTEAASAGCWLEAGSTQATEAASTEAASAGCWLEAGSTQATSPTGRSMDGKGPAAKAQPSASDCAAVSTCADGGTGCSQVAGGSLPPLVGIPFAPLVGCSVDIGSSAAPPAQALTAVPAVPSSGCSAAPDATGAGSAAGEAVGWFGFARTTSGILLDMDEAAAAAGPDKRAMYGLYLSAAGGRGGLVGGDEMAVREAFRMSSAGSTWFTRHVTRRHRHVSSSAGARGPPGTRPF